MGDTMEKITDVSETVIGTWFERDRSHVCLSRADADGEAGPTIVEWWDGAVEEAVDGGFLDPRAWHASAFAYARTNGILDARRPVTIALDKVGFVAHHPDKGLYLGWNPGGLPRWAADASEEQVARGAYVFTCEADLAEVFESDAARLAETLDGDGLESALAEHGLDSRVVAYPVGLGVPETSNAVVSKLSVAACEAAGVPAPSTSAPSL